MTPRRPAALCVMITAGLLLALSPAPTRAADGKASDPKCPSEAAAAKSPADAYALGWAYDAGSCSLPHDPARAAEWYRKAADNNYVPAEYALGDLYFTAGNNYPEAKKWFLKAAEKGDAKAALRMAYLCIEAHYGGLQPDFAEGEKWLTIAAEKDVGDARFRLGNFYANYKRPREYDKAYTWLKKAADGGNRTAMFDLSRLIIFQQVKSQPAAEGVEWLHKAAEAGVISAQTMLIEAYSIGKYGIKTDAKAALKWVLLLADSPTASPLWLDRAGDIFYDGWMTIPANYPKALSYYERAAAKGDQRARGRLGEMYAMGRGVKKDPEKAKEYFSGGAALQLPDYSRRAAEQLNAPVLHTNGAPVLQKH